jgi:hypothetical protein
MKTSPALYAQWLDEGPTQAPPEGLVSGTLRWILRRLNDGLVEPRDGQRTTFLTIGNDEPDQPLSEAFTSEVQKRRRAVNLAGVFAEARERGVNPEHMEVSEELRFQANDAGYMNAEFHYAMQLMDVLREMRRRSFELVTLPLLGHASEQLIDLLHEATRAHLFGLHSASLALCRAVLERALREKVPVAAVQKERDRSPKRGDLENLINAAATTRLFDSYLTSLAHGLRIRANAIMHGSALVEDSVVNIGDTRILVERLFA